MQIKFSLSKNKFFWIILALVVLLGIPETRHALADYLGPNRKVITHETETIDVGYGQRMTQLEIRAIILMAQIVLFVLGKAAQENHAVMRNIRTKQAQKPEPLTLFPTCLKPRSAVRSKTVT